MGLPRAGTAATDADVTTATNMSERRGRAEAHDGAGRPRTAGVGSDGATYDLTPHESVRVLSHSPEALEVEGRWAPHGQAPPKHFHPEQDERFEVLEGELHVRVDGHESVLRRGDVLEVPRGAVHQMWNEGGVPATAVWRTSPAGRTAGWFADLSAMRRSGRVGRNGMPGPLAFGVYLTAYDDVIRLAGPQPLVRPVLAVLGLIGRLRGYRPGGMARAGAPR